MDADSADPSSVVARMRRHLEHGAPWDACDAFREHSAALAHEPGFLYWGALAHARSGALHEALALLDKAQAAAREPSLLREILCLRGRLWKDRFDRSGERGFAARARAEYLAAYELARDPFPGINAATLSLLTGDRASAHELASAILASLAAKREPWTAWDHATAGEAQLLLDDSDGAAERYATACALSGAGDVASMRRQVALIARIVPRASEMLAQLPTADVVAFAGHMIDAAEREAPRFPAALEPQVEAALRDELSRLRQPIVYTSAACGADLICIEQALARGAEVNVVLPFDRGDFVRTSVAPGGEAWIARFDAALTRAARVVMATEENHLGDDVLYDHAARLVDGLATLRAAQLATRPSLLGVVDPSAAGDVGGTLATLSRWRRRTMPVRVIDLRALRGESVADTAPTRIPPLRPAAGPSQRSIKALLFADFAGYSRLHDAYAPLFQSRFLEIGARRITQAAAKPLEAKTWGDALYLVFASQADAAEFALAFLDDMRAADWTAMQLPASSQVRVALHAGPVFRTFDPVMDRDSFFGADVTRAARIEPVTPPGTVYASEAFAATLAAEQDGRFALEYVGLLPLAKDYGESRLYRLERR